MSDALDEVRPFSPKLIHSQSVGLQGTVKVMRRGNRLLISSISNVRRLRMYRSTRTAITVGTAVMTLYLGLPLAQAISSYDHTGGRYQSNSADGQYYTDQYGDLDVLEDQDRMKRDRSAGYWNREVYRSNASNRNPRSRPSAVR